MKHKVKHIHFVGIGGAGMSARRVLLKGGIRSAARMWPKPPYAPFEAAGAAFHRARPETRARLECGRDLDAIKHDNP